MEQIRSFIAIELPAPVKAALAQLETRLKSPQITFVKWVDVEGIHITLKFLGNMPADRIEPITETIKKAAVGIPPFRLELDEPGAFPSTRSPRVVWVGLKGELNCLIDLQQRIEKALIPLGFPAESRAFSPHLTLGRVRQGAIEREHRLLGELVRSTKLTQSPPPFQVEAISLMKSTLTPAGAIHSRLAEVPLAHV